MLAIGVISSIIIATRAISPLVSIAFLLAGFIVTAIGSLMLLAISKLVHLFIDMEEDLSEIGRLMKK